jgi:hypothetical protein
VVPDRYPLAATVDDKQAAVAIAGWESLVLDLGGRPHGLRVITVLLDADDRPIGVTDHVMLRSAGVPGSANREPEPPRVRHESLGGRIEGDGSLTGTRWVMEGEEPVEGQTGSLTSHSRPLTVDEADALTSLATAVVARAPSRRRG